MPNQQSATSLTAQSSVGASNSTESEPVHSEVSLPEAPAVEPPVTITMSSFDDYTELPPPPLPEAQIEYMRAIYDYEATNSEEISFSAGDIIEIIDSSSEDGWWTGKNSQGAIGHFPSLLVGDLEDEEEEEEDEESEEDDDDNSHANLPTLPPVLSAPPDLPPVIAPPGGELLEGQVNGGAPTFAPPPKPTSLMTPQTVVIIQPTPEIESKPMLGSEEYEEEEEGPNATCQESSESTTSESGATVERKQSEPTVKRNVNGDTAGEPGSIKVSMAIAAQEVSQTITQQVIDDSIAELSRRASAASSYDGSVQEATIEATIDAAAENEEVPAIPQTNGNIANCDGTSNGDDEEDCK